MRRPRFNHFVAVDWSGASGERHKGIAVAVADAGGGPPVLVRHRWSREDVLAILRDLPEGTLVGLDLGLSLPFCDCGAFFPGWPESPPDARALWALVERLSAADPQLGEHWGAQGFVDHPEASRYFRRHGGREGAAFRCDEAGHGRGRFRVTELEQARMGCKPYSNFNLVGAAQVGKSSLTGMRVLHALGGAAPVWPIDFAQDRPIDPLPDGGPVVVEIYTTLAAMAAGRSPGRAKMRSHEALNEALAALRSPPVPGTGALDDHATDAILAAAWLREVADRPELWRPAKMTPHIARTEGWTFGVA